MQRVVQPEILDSLPEDHPAAIANRRDLRLINGVMGNYRWFCETLPPRVGPGDRVLELGAGTGELGLRLREVCPDSLPHYCGLDLWTRPPAWPSEWEWVRENLLTFEGYSDYTVIIANLILHQFNDEELRHLGNRLVAAGSIRLILASEPARRRLHQWQLKLMRPLGLHPVSRHDGHVSIAGGFQQRELPDLLGLTGPEWQVQCGSSVFGCNRTVAWRGESPVK